MVANVFVLLQKAEVIFVMVMSYVCVYVCVWRGVGKRVWDPLLKQYL